MQSPTNGLNSATQNERRIYSVSELTQSIKSVLEDRFAFLWISGEISNFKPAASGHWYFTLKDERSQIQAVMFRGQSRNLNFDLHDGLSIVGLGRISVYEPRGAYQIIFEFIEPKGAGALQLAFEKLKNRLFEEGLFDVKHKKPLPGMPRKISLVTSPTGAVVHDMIHVIQRRFPSIHIEIVPVKVQGETAADDIVQALKLLDERSDSDVIILARGGGSLEDLQAFNSESVARAVFDARIPLISAIGHEIDFTICDFVADLRAPTPSAAAELVVPLKKELVRRTMEYFKILKYKMLSHIDGKRLVLNLLSKRLVDPKKRIYDHRLRLDDYTSRLFCMADRNIRRQREQLQWRVNALYTNNPYRSIYKNKDKLNILNDKLLLHYNNIISEKTYEMRSLYSRLRVLNPSSILQRGYSVTRTIPDAVVIRNADETYFEQQLEILLAQGKLICRVERKLTDGQENI